MALYNFSLWTKAYPAITNRIRGSVLSWDGVTVIASIIDTTVGHPSRLWSYAGLPYANYKWSLDEIDGGGIVIQNLSAFDAVPSVIDGQLTRNKEQLQVDAALSGLVSGASTATLDGTGGIPDFRGWKIVIAEYGDTRNILIEGLDYTWVPDTGLLTLLQGEKFIATAWWTFLFIAQTQTQGNSAPTVFDYTTRLIQINDSIVYDDFGNAILAEPTGVYMELQLPDITTIPIGRPLRIPFGGVGFACTKLLKYGTDSIAFLKGNIYGIPGEYIEIVRYHYSTGVNQWKVNAAFGNFARVGDIVYSDQSQSQMLQAKFMNGSSELNTTYARIYNEVVLNLPGACVCNYDDDRTGANKYKFSLANSGNPANANKFFFPDLRGITIKSVSGILTAASFEDWVLPDHKHESEGYSAGSGGHFGCGVTSRALMGTFQSLLTGLAWLTNIPCNTDGTAWTNGGSETKVKSVLKNPYILV